MADRKITALTALGAIPDDADLLEIVDDVAGTPTSKKVTIANLLGAVPRVVATASPSGVSEVDFTLPSGYGTFKIIGHLLPATDSVNLQILCDDGGGFDTTNEYGWVVRSFSFGGVGTTADDSGSAFMRFNGDAVGNLSNEGASFEVQIDRALDAAHTLFNSQGAIVNQAANITKSFGAGRHAVAAALTQIRIQFSSGNIADGELRLIGIP